jgi:hypothetical protein
MKICNDNVLPTIKGHDVKILAAHGPKDMLEGPESEASSLWNFPACKRRGPGMAALRIAKCARIN